MKLQNGTPEREDYLMQLARFNLTSSGKMTAGLIVEALKPVSLCLGHVITSFSNTVKEASVKQ